eukprot:scaffold18142_cov96-Isochrysis_galbana.AAC.1
MVQAGSFLVKPGVSHIGSGAAPACRLSPIHTLLIHPFTPDSHPIHIPFSPACRLARNRRRRSPMTAS